MKHSDGLVERRIEELVCVKLKELWGKVDGDCFGELIGVHVHIKESPHYTCRLLMLWIHYISSEVIPGATGAHLLLPSSVAIDEEWSASQLARIATKCLKQDLARL